MSTNIDASGLPESVVNDIRKLVNTLQTQISIEKDPIRPQSETPEEWAKRLLEWVKTHDKRSVEIDDSRESIYSGRGE